jgi:hypothetical protein
LLLVQWPDADSGRSWLAELVPRLATNAAVASFNARFSDARRNSGRDQRLYSHFGTMPQHQVARTRRRCIGSCAAASHSDSRSHRALAAHNGIDARRSLVFQCYQSRLADQFVFLQQAWINNQDFPGANTGNDAVIGLASTVGVRAGGQGPLPRLRELRPNRRLRFRTDPFAYDRQSPRLGRAAAIHAGGQMSYTTSSMTAMEPRWQA